LCENILTIETGFVKFSDGVFAGISLKEEFFVFLPIIMECL